MRVRQLGVFGFRGRLDREWSEMTHAPTWQQIETAIRRLDAGEYAGVNLSLKARRDDEPASEYFSVTGGPKGYIFGYHVGGRNLEYIASDADEPDEFVGVVQRDQGVWVPARYVCYDVEVVLKAARWFFETGEPHPEVSWKK